MPPHWRGHAATEEHSRDTFSEAAATQRRKLEQQGKRKNATFKPRTSIALISAKDICGSLLESNLSQDDSEELILIRQIGATCQE